MKLLLAIDGTAASHLALEEVAARPWPQNTQVEVLTVTEPPHLWATSEAAEEVAVRAKALIGEAVEFLSGKGMDPAGNVISGHPEQVIIERAKKSDLVVIGSHESSGVTTFLTGSVASAVASHCSVEIVRARNGSAPGNTARKILLATDGSEDAANAARSIAGRPWPAGTEFRILSVVDLVLPPVNALLEPGFVHLTNVEERRAEAMRQAEDAVNDALQILGPQAATSISVLLDGPAKVILQEADAWEADLIVVGSHGHTALDRLLLGSVSQEVAMDAHCSVEVIRRRI